MTSAHYRERLWPGWAMTTVAGCIVAMLAIAYGAALGQAVGLLVLVGAGVLVGLLTWVTSPQIVVDEHAVRAGGAALPRRALASARVVDAAEIRAARGPGADARNFTMLRTWATKRGVVLVVNDPADPHPRWLLSSRHPEALVDSLTATMTP